MLVLMAQRGASQGITIDAADVQAIFTIGSTLTYNLDTLTSLADIGAPGESFWDFEGLNTTSVTTLESLPVASTPYAPDFPQATFALRDGAFTYSFFYAALGSDVTLKGTGYIYYNLQGALLNSGFKGAGNAYLVGNPYPAQGQWLNSPASVEYSLPLQFGTAWTSDYAETISGSATLAGMTFTFGPTVTMHSVQYSVDAYGLVTLPGGRTYDALRIRKADTYSGAGLRVTYILLAKNGATVQLTVADPNATSGAVEVSGVRWSEGNRNIVVPIQLSRFTAARQEGEGVLLEWTTMSETNNFGFHVQRKGIGDREFSDLPGGFVAGHGTTVVPQTYSYRDANGGAAECWYRLRQVDLDGSVHFSEPVRADALAGVQETAPAAYALAQNFPNPFNPSTTIRYSLPTRSYVTMSVFNALGQMVAQLVNGEVEAGHHETTFDAAGLPSGIYLYRMQARPVSSPIGRDSPAGADGFIQSRRLLLLR